MKIFHFQNKLTELWFTNFEHRDGMEELKEVISILKNAGCLFVEKGWYPDYVWYQFKINNFDFKVLYDEFELSGCVIRTEDEQCMMLIENIFINAGIEWYENS